MSIVVTGSIATDYLMVFPGRFRDQLVDGELDRVSLSFLVDELEIRRGGVAANISFGLGRLGLAPVLVGGVGSDFAEYRAWLERHGVRTSGVRVSENRHTARFLCTTDADQNQIASFYAGAMADAREIELAPVVTGLEHLDVVVVSPNDPVAMLRHADECRQRGYPFAADPSQQLARLDGEEIRSLVDGATYLFTNSYERRLLEHKTGWSDEEIRRRVGTSVTTMSEKGALVERAGEPSVTVPVVPARSVADPTGVGDAFRAGFLAGTVWQLGDERSAQLGAALATLAIETVGTQEYAFEPSGFLERFSETYGSRAAAEVAAHIRPRLQPRQGG